MHSTGVIVAGGSGLRMKGRVRKQYLQLGGMPILGKTLLVFDRCDAVDDMVLAVPFEDLDFCEQTVISPLLLKKPVRLTVGGAERQESVFNGLRTAEKLGAQIVAIHDGVRPLVTETVIIRCLHGAMETGACIPGIPAFDTVKSVDEQGRIRQTLPRDRLWLAQTPQSFRFDLILAAHEAARREGFRGTDDASLVERLGHPVMMIPGSRRNIKITTPEDLLLAEALLESGPSFVQK
jgi:2-C-methyl-D-erythritol 4-phosphate cytidylyltransferase